MAKLYNLARMTTATAGTGTITLGAAVTGFLTFAQAGVSNGDVVAYGIRDGTNSEVGTGTYTSSGTTLTRTVIKSTNSDSAISLSGTAHVYISALKEHIANLTEANTFSAAQTVQISPGANTFTSGVELINPGTASAGNVQLSPYLYFKGAGWKTDSGGASQVLEWFVTAMSTDGGTSQAYNILRFYNQTGGGGLTEFASLRDVASQAQLYLGSTHSAAGLTLLAGNNALATLYADNSQVLVVATLNIPMKFYTNNTLRAVIPNTGGLVVGNQSSALATNATDGFLYIPTCAGAPSGTPTAQTGTVAMIYDTTNNKLYVYNGAWKGGTAPGAWS